MKNTVTQQQIQDIMDGTEFEFRTAYGKCTIVIAKLPSGFIIVESSACVDPVNYDEKVGVEICTKRIVDKVWELEGYRLQSEVANDGN